MKFAIVFVCCIFAFREAADALKLPQEVVDLLKTLSETCQEETGADQGMVAEVRKGNIVDDPKIKCYLKCIMRQLQTLREDGNLDMEVIDATMPEVVRKHGGMETMEKCKGVHADDLCETAYQLVVCFKRENPELAPMFE